MTTANRAELSLVLPAPACEKVDEGRSRAQGALPTPLPDHTSRSINCEVSPRHVGRFGVADSHEAETFRPAGHGSRSTSSPGKRR